MIRYVKHDDIDKERWDECIQHSASPLIYAKAVYLDHMAGEWDALVMDDYRAVMPLTWRSKFGIKYLYQPAFTQQLGVFAKKELYVELKLTELFINECKRYFNFAEINLNESNSVEGLLCRTNFVLALDLSHDQRRAGYKTSFQQHLTKASKQNLLYRSTTMFDEIVRSFSGQQRFKMRSVKRSDYKKFSTLCSVLSVHGMCIAREVISNNEAVARVILLKDEKRIYNIMSFITAHGRELRANHFLYDSILNEFSNTGMLFDLEGSDVPGVRDFYAAFGGVDRPYYFLRYNHLHPLLRWGKKVIG